MNLLSTTASPHRAHRRTITRFVALLITVILGRGAVAAQQLAPGLCPAGSPFNIQPTFSTFFPGMPGIPLLRHTINTAVYTDAECNDGSPAVMYIRPANAAYAGNPIVNPSSKWVIFLDGGASCQDADSCLLERWCSGGGQIFDRAGKMSSQGAAQAIISPGGIFELVPPSPLINHFADYNHVLVHYCSSDNWIGSGEKLGLSTTTGTFFDIEFRGEAIVNAVFATLQAGATRPDLAPAGNFYATQLPDLRDASEIILAAESAGGGGLRHHLDRLRESVILPVATNPNVVVRGLIDAGAPPDMGGATLTYGAPGAPVNYADFLLNFQEPVVRGFWEADDSALDQSCLNPVWAPWHIPAGGHPQVCYDTTYTLLNHITTPVFLRQDINDPLGKMRYVAWSLFPAPDDFWSATFNQLTLFGSYAPAVGGLEPPLASPGVQGPKCGLHVAVQTNNGFFRHTVVAPGLLSLSFHDLFVNWLNGLPPGPDTIQIQTDNLGPGFYTASFCP
ncbi:MAG TPA: pectin acetylesterase-family hydrolase [Thermoanaerobaculia bacterium]